MELKIIASKNGNSFYYMLILGFTLVKWYTYSVHDEEYKGIIIIC